MGLDTSQSVSDWFVTWAERVVADAEAAAGADLIASSLSGIADAGGMALLAGVLDTVGAFTLPEIIAVVLLILLVMWMIAMIFKPLAAIGGAVPFVGGHFKDFFNTVSNDIIGIVEDAFRGAYIVGSNFLKFLWGISFGAIYSLAHGVGSTAVYAFQTAVTALPDLYAQLLAVIGVAENAAINQAYQWSSEAWQHADAIGAEDRAYTDTQVGGAINQAYQWSSEAWQHADAVGAAVENDLHNAVAGVTQEIGDVVQNVELKIGQATSTAEQFATNAANAAAGAVDNALTPEITALTAVATLTASQLQKYLDNCGTDMCQANGKNARNVNSLSGPLGLAALLAFLAAAVKEPKATADDTATVFDPIVGIAGGVLNTLIGAVV